MKSVLFVIAGIVMFYLCAYIVHFGNSWHAGMDIAVTLVAGAVLVASGIVEMFPREAETTTSKEEKPLNDNSNRGD